jgi:hypothetical protein
VQILTYYYPVVADLFRNLARRDRDRVARLERWVGQLEERIAVMPAAEQIVDSAALAMNAWNNKKRSILRRASSIEVAAAIYATIAALEDETLSGEEKQTLSRATTLCEDRQSRGGSNGGRDSVLALPDSQRAGHWPDDLRRFFSRLA